MISLPYTLVVPTPENILQFAWLAMGITFGRGFGKDLDQSIQQTKEFLALNWWQQKAVKIILDVTHHWWIGMLMVLYLPMEEAIWFGWGLILDDSVDIPARFGIDSIKNRLYGNGEEPKHP